MKYNSFFIASWASCACYPCVMHAFPSDANDAFKRMKDGRGEIEAITILSFLTTNPLTCAHTYAKNHACRLARSCVVTAHKPSFAFAFPAFLLFSLQQVAPREQSSSSSRRVSRRLEQTTRSLSAMNEAVHWVLTRAIIILV